MNAVDERGKSVGDFNWLMCEGMVLLYPRLIALKTPPEARANAVEFENIVSISFFSSRRFRRLLRKFFVGACREYEVEPGGGKGCFIPGSRTLH